MPLDHIPIAMDLDAILSNLAPSPAPPAQRRSFLIGVLMRIARADIADALAPGHRDHRELRRREREALAMLDRALDLQHQACLAPTPVAGPKPKPRSQAVTPATRQLVPARGRTAVATER